MTGPLFFQRRLYSSRSAIAALIAAMVLAGCSHSDFDTVYGRRSGTRGGASVNGTAVLADMFRQKGCVVSRKSRLSPVFERYDTVVWTPDAFSLPSDEVQQFFDKWLSNAPGRTLIYVGRDYDAAIGYWEQVQDSAPPEQAVEVTRRLAQARAAHDSRRAGMPIDKNCRWFQIQRDGQKTVIGRGQTPPPIFSGPWAESTIDPAGVEIELEGRLKPTADQTIAGNAGGRHHVQPLLQAGEEILAFEVTNDFWPDSRIVVVNNGSFLLNLPLVRPEHRKLAGQLIGGCKVPGKVVFLESEEGGPQILAREDKDYPTGLEMFTVWPLNIVLFHFLAAGVLAILCRTAIFGRPHELPPAAVSDFRKHIRALGQLLARTKNHPYAQARVRHYHEQVKRDSGASHQKKPGA